MKEWQAKVIALLICLVVVAIIGVIVFGGYWLIGTSELPDWMKFGLLS